MTPVTPRPPFHSPWQNPAFVAMIGLARRMLRPWEALEHRLVMALVRAQNARVRRYLARWRPREVLLIMPRCLKKVGCREDVQKSLDPCLACRQCPLGDVAAVCREHEVTALVAFRSQAAFDMARQRQPDLIIAAACHDRMIKALRSVPEVPALLAPLSGMDRMCVNATVDQKWLAEQLAVVAPVASQQRAAV